MCKNKFLKSVRYLSISYGKYLEKSTDEGKDTAFLIALLCIGIKLNNI